VVLFTPEEHKYYPIQCVERLFMGFHHGYAIGFGQAKKKPQKNSSAAFVLKRPSDQAFRPAFNTFC
jgi:hypothetical protein